jgi:hypothetical protein
MDLEAIVRIFLCTFAACNFFMLGRNTNPYFMKIRERWASKYSLLGKNGFYWTCTILTLLPLAIFIADRIVDFSRK